MKIHSVGPHVGDFVFSGVLLMLSVSFVQPRLRAVSLAAALAVSSVAAQAQVTAMEARFAYTLGAAGTPEAGVDSLAGNPSATRVDAFVHDISGPDSVFTHSFGSTTGNFGSRSSGVGIYDMAGSFKIVQTVTNTSDSAQNAKFNFYISPGLLANNLGSAPLQSGDYVKAGLSFDVKRDGMQIWGSTGLLQTGFNSAPAFSSTGDNSLYTLGGSQVVIKGVAKSVDLGVINAHESITLSYELGSFAQGHSLPTGQHDVPSMTYTIPDTWVNMTCGGGYGYGGGGYGGGGYGGSCTPGPKLVPGYTFTVPGYTIYDTASSSFGGAGDPFTIDFYGTPKYTTNGIVPPGVLQGVTFSALAPVPEPGTWALMAAGLAMLSSVAKRRKAVSAS
jgi:PEP-CTERM motif